MKKLKIILRNPYIGAIAIGYLVARGIEACVGAFMPAFNALLTNVLDWQRTRKRLLDRRGSRMNDFEFGADWVVSFDRVPIHRLVLYEAC
jgi:hypothetical protein